MRPSRRASSATSRELMLAALADRRALRRQRRHGAPASRRARRRRRWSCGTRTLVEEHLVEVDGAVDLPQRPHVDAGGVHVDQEVGDARVLGHVRVRAGEADAPVGRCGPTTSTPSGRSITHSSPSRIGARGEAARSEPAPGSLKSWHHTSSPRSIGVEEALSLLGRAVGHQRRADHVDADHEEVRRHVEAASSSANTPASIPVRPRPPWSTGQWMAAHPPSNFVRCHALAHLELRDVLRVGLGPERPPVAVPLARVAWRPTRARPGPRLGRLPRRGCRLRPLERVLVRSGSTVEPMDLPVMPPVKPMLAKAVHEVPRDRRPALRAQVGRVPLHRVP